MARKTAVDSAAQAGLVAAAWFLSVRLQDGPVLVERALSVLTFAGGVAASILLLVAAWMSGNRSARCVAAAVAVYAGVALLLRAVQADPEAGVWVLLASVGVLGVVALLVLAVRGPVDAARGGRVLKIVVGLVVAGTVAIGATAMVIPGPVPILVAISVADLVAWSGVGAAGLLLVLVGLPRDRPLLRRIGLAFTTIGVAHAIRLSGWHASTVVVEAFELAAVAMFLVAALPFLLVSVQHVWREQEKSDSRLAEAEAVMASVAERDHELRNLVAGLSGAASVLTGQITTTADGRVLLAAAGAELDRLRRMLDAGRTTPEPTEIAVGPVLRDLAAVHGASGMDVEVDVEGDPRVVMDGSALAQVVANLLVNCARHAPGAAVRLRVRSRGDEVLVEVSDDGPGLPPGWSDAVLRRGLRGPRSTGQGLGLAIIADLVRVHGGSFTLRSAGAGCTAVVGLPSADLRLAVQRLGA